MSYFPKQVYYQMLSHLGFLFSNTYRISSLAAFLIHNNFLPYAWNKDHQNSLLALELLTPATSILDSQSSAIHPHPSLRQ